MKISKDVIRDVFLDILLYDTKYDPEYFYQDYSKEIDMIVDEICDPSILVMTHLTEKQTFVIKKRLGMCDLGETQTLKSISKDNDVTKEAIRQIESRVYVDLLNLILKGNYAPSDDKTKMSSLCLTEEYPNYSLAKLGFEGKLKRTLCLKPKTLYNLLSYGKRDLRKTIGIGPEAVENLEIYLKEKGFRLIDELTDKERIQIISNSKIEVINNSSIYWIKNLDSYYYSHLSKAKVNNIGRLREYIINGGKINKEVIDYALSIGIDLTKEPVKELIKK